MNSRGSDTLYLVTEGSNVLLAAPNDRTVERIEMSWV